MIVVDTNILVYRFLRHERNEPANALACRDPEWAAPLLWRSEFRNVIARFIRQGSCTVEEVERVIDRVAAHLLGGEHSVADRVVLGFVARSRCTAYDCEFAGLAVSLGTILVTEDRALLGAFPRFCRSLDDVVKKGLPG